MVHTHSRTKTVATPPLSVIPALLPLPDEPRELRAEVRTLVEQTPADGIALIERGEWIAAPLWESWQPVLESRGLQWTDFLEIVTNYSNELRLWVVGERLWEHCVEGLAGRVARRLP